MRVNCPKLVKMAIFKPHNSTKNNHRWNISSTLSPGQQYFLNDKKNSVKNGLLKSRILSEEKKPSPSTNIPFFFVSKVGTKSFFEVVSASRSQKTNSKFQVLVRHTKVVNNYRSQKSLEWATSQLWAIFHCNFEFIGEVETYFFWKMQNFAWKIFVISLLAKSWNRQK